jgi:hypothetical protein
VAADLGGQLAAAQASLNTLTETDFAGIAEDVGALAAALPAQLTAIEDTIRRTAVTGGLVLTGTTVFAASVARRLATIESRLTGIEDALTGAGETAAAQADGGEDVAVAGAQGSACNLAEADRALRVRIEESLLESDRRIPVSVFYLPAERGGMLECVREIVTEMLVGSAADGFEVDDAWSLFDGGEAAMSAGEYRRAWARFGAAYREAASHGFDIAAVQ